MNATGRYSMSGHGHMIINLNANGLHYAHQHNAGKEFEKDNLVTHQSSKIQDIQREKNLTECLKKSDLGTRVRKYID
jgi:hypothetical protein